MQIAQAVDQRLLSGTADSKGLYKAAAKAAGQRRILMWDSDKTVESLLSSGTLGGTVPTTTAPFVGPVIIDYNANKLDYYLKTDVQWVSTGCGSTRSVTVTIKLTNDAPADLPTYVNQRTDDPPAGAKPGDNQILLYYIGTDGGQLDQITVNGQTGSIEPGTEGDHPTYSTLVEVPRGETQTVTLSLSEPGGRLPILMHQPGVVPMAVDARTAEC